MDTLTRLLNAESRAWAAVTRLYREMPREDHAAEVEQLHRINGALNAVRVFQLEQRAERRGS